MSRDNDTIHYDFATGGVSTEYVSPYPHTSKFYGDALNKIVSTFTGRHMTGEDIRLELESYGIVPPSVNMWGQLMRQATRGGYITQTGDFVQAQRKEAKGRRVAMYFVG